MWFGNASLYLLPKQWDMSAEKLEGFLSLRKFAGVGSLDRSLSGFVNPKNPSEIENLVHSVNGSWLIALKTEEKILPASVINKEASKRAKELEKTQGFRPGRKQLREIKENLDQELLPKALTKESVMYCFINREKGYLVIDASNQAKSGVMLDALRSVVDGICIGSLNVAKSPSSVMSNALGEQDIDGFTVDDETLLVSVGEDKAEVRYRKQALTDESIAEEILGHLANGLLPKKLAMTFDDRISFVLADDFSIKRLCFLDCMKEDANESVENEDELFDSIFYLMSAEVTRLIDSLIDLHGGEVKEDA